MNQKILSEIKHIAKEIEGSSNLNISELKKKVSNLHDKLVVLEFLEGSIVNLEQTTIEEEVIEPHLDSISDSLEFLKDEIADEKEIVVSTTTEKAEEIVEEVIRDIAPTSSTIEESNYHKSINDSIDNKRSSLHNELKKSTIQIGLNDRIAFVKRLFGGNQQDFHRVLSQVNTFSTIDEVREFIDTMVRPEHGWDDQDEYAERFMEIIEVKFQ